MAYQPSHQDLQHVVAAESGRSIGPIMAAIVTLAALDLAGAALARSWADSRSTISLVGGVVVFGLLFIVYGKSLDYAELTTVTIGWVVMLQVGVVVLDLLHGAVITPSRLGAIALIVVLQAFIMVSDLSS